MIEINGKGLESEPENMSGLNETRDLYIIVEKMREKLKRLIELLPKEIKDH